MYGDPRYLLVRALSFPTRGSSYLLARKAPASMSHHTSSTRSVICIHLLERLAARRTGPRCHARPKRSATQTFGLGASSADPKPQQNAHQAERQYARRPDRRHPTDPLPEGRSEEHTSELQSLMRIAYAVFCVKTKKAQSTTPWCTLHINQKQ